jgi:hypothetical protein
MTPRTVASLALLAVSTSTASVADAQPGATATFVAAPAPAPVTARTRWYGWQILLVDAGVITAGLAMSDEDSELAGKLTLAGLVLSGPIVHGLNGHGGRALGSLGLRVAFPTAGLMLGAASCKNDPDSEGLDAWDCLGNVAVGGLVGALTAEVIDVAWGTTFETLPVTPVVNATTRSTTLGLAGRF